MRYIFEVKFFKIIVIDNVDKLKAEFQLRRTRCILISRTFEAATNFKAYF